MSKLYKLLIIFTILCLTWHLGRWYEFKTLGQGVNAYYIGNPERTDMFINAIDDRHIKGELRAGVCYKFR